APSASPTTSIHVHSNSRRLISRRAGGSSSTMMTLIVLPGCAHLRRPNPVVKGRAKYSRLGRKSGAASPPSYADLYLPSSARRRSDGDSLLPGEALRRALLRPPLRDRPEVAGQCRA